MFYFSLLERKTTSKKQVNKTISQLEFDKNGEEYKVKGICNSAVYARKSNSYLSGLYYLIAWKDYLKKRNI